ncbi:hypothetical protein CSUI_005781, partial [Cystoisospora suis]
DDSALGCAVTLCRDKKVQRCARRSLLPGSLLQVVTNPALIHERE